MTVITGRQLRAARILLNWDQISLAAKADVGVGTVRRMEAAEGAISSHTATLRRVIAAMERAGIEFIANGVRLKEP